MINTKKIITCLYAGVAVASAMEEKDALALDPNVLIFEGSKTIKGYEYLEFDTSLGFEGIHTDKSVISKWNVLVVNNISIHQTESDPKEEVKEITLIIPGKVKLEKDEWSIYIAPKALSVLDSESLRLNLIFGEGVTFSSDCSYMFYRSKSIVEIDLSNIDSTVTSARAMFKECSNLKSIRFGKFKTNEITTMKEMFHNCRSLKELNLENFDTNKVTTMSKMFYNCRQLTTLKFGDKFNTKDVINMNYMFYSCNNLKELNLRTFNTNNVRYMQRMFSDCYALKELDLESFDTGNVINMFGMFDFCENLINLDISSFSVEKIKDMRSMFANCEHLSKSLPKYTKDHVEYADLVKKYAMFTESNDYDPSDPEAKDDMPGD